MQITYKCLIWAAMMFVICLSFIFLPKNMQALLAVEEAAAKAFIEKYKTAQVVTGKTLLNESKSFKKKIVLFVGKLRTETEGGYTEFLPVEWGDNEKMSFFFRVIDVPNFPKGTITLAARVERFEEAKIFGDGIRVINLPILKYIEHFPGDVTK